MTRPGTRLRSLAHRLLGSTTMEKLIDPLIADLQFEHAEALREGRVWRSRWIAVTGCIAFWRVAVHAWVFTKRHGTRAIALALSTATVITTLAILVVLANTPATVSTQGKMAWLILYLLPQGFAISLPICLALGLFIWLRNERVDAWRQRTSLWLMRLALLLAIVNIGWIVPAGNNAFRNLVLGAAPSRGVNELTVIELGTRLYQGSPGAAVDGALPMVFWMNARLALAIAPMLLAALALAGAKTARRRSAAIVVLTTLTIFAGCYLLYSPDDIAILMRWMPAAAIAWIPDAVAALATISLARQA